MHARSDGAGGFFSAEHDAHGDAVGDGLGEGGDVGQDAEVLVRTPFAGAAHAGLDFVADEERAGGVAEVASGLQELGGDEVNAAFALEDFKGDGADFG